MEADTKAGMETYELNADIAGLTFHVRPDAGHLGASKKFSVNDSNGNKVFATPRFDYLGLFKDGFGHSVQADLGVELALPMVDFSVGVNTGEHFKFKKDNVTVTGQSDLNGFIEAKSNNGLTARLDTNGKTTVGFTFNF